jgi:holliday junction DNA helicase RuvA
MIEYLTGKVLRRTPTSIIIDVQGVGYGVEMPLSALCETPPHGSDLSLWIDTYVREDALRLFGFLSYEDRQAFIMLRNVSGIGPKIALAILSTFDATSLRQLIMQNKATILESVPGIGRRTAEKIVIELRGKIERLGLSASSSPLKGASIKGINKTTTSPDNIDGLLEFSELNTVFEDVRSALENLGYRDKEINPVISELQKNTTQDPPTEFQLVLKTALRSLRAGV